MNLTAVVNFLTNSIKTFNCAHVNGQMVANQETLKSNVKITSGCNILILNIVYSEKKSLIKIIKSLEETWNRPFLKKLMP